MIRALFSLIAVFYLLQAQSEAPRPVAGGADLPAAERTLEAAVKSRPSAAAWEKLGLVRHLQNRFDDAIPAFREAIRLNPSLWTSHLFLGIGLYRTNQFTSALASLEAADKLSEAKSPGRDDVDYWLAATHIALRKPLQALRPLETLLERNPKHLEALELAVRTYADLSAALWSDIAERNFESAAGYEVHGHALESEGNRKGALEAFRRSKAINPKRAGPGLAIGRLLLMEGKPEEALGVLEAELKLPAADPETFYYAGLAATTLQRYREAAEWLVKASEWPDRNPEAGLALAQVYLALDQIAEAIEAARRAVAAKPASPVAHELLLAALVKAGQQAEADAERLRWSRIGSTQ